MEAVPEGLSGALTMDLRCGPICSEAASGFIQRGDPVEVLDELSDPGCSDLHSQDLLAAHVTPHDIATFMF
ncbi:MAG: hypothetical protein KUG71_06540 [Porticoccaceae bacterium]|nr:hypothetical protein [Porticoccaceae bacterium]